MFSPCGHPELGPLGSGGQCPAAWQCASPRLSTTGKMQPTASKSQVVILHIHLPHGHLVLARQKLKDPCPTLSCTAQKSILIPDSLEMWSVELQLCAPLHCSPTTPQFCPSAWCQVVFDRNTCFCGGALLCRVRN